MTADMLAELTPRDVVLSPGRTGVLYAKHSTTSVGGGGGGTLACLNGLLSSTTLSAPPMTIIGPGTTVPAAGPPTTATAAATTKNSSCGGNRAGRGVVSTAAATTTTMAVGPAATTTDGSASGKTNGCGSGGGSSGSNNNGTPPNRDCIQIVNFFQRKTAETACLEARLSKNHVSRVCVIRPNSVFYTLADSFNRKLYCCMATRDNVTQAGKPIYSFRKSIVEITNLSHDGRVRVGVLGTDGIMHILSLVANGTQSWERVASVPTDLNVSFYREVAYSRSFNSLFWPVPCGDHYDIVSYGIESGQTKVILRGMENCTLQVKQDALVLLFYHHGVLFVPFSELTSYLTSTTGSTTSDDNAEKESMTSDLQCSEHPAGLRSADALTTTTVPSRPPSATKMNSCDERPVYGDYWSPSATQISRVQTDSFEAHASESHLRGYCLSHDRMVVFAMYGQTIFRLSGTSCTPLTSIEVPAAMDRTFRVMFLGRITVLQGDTMTAAYLNSSKPVKILHKNYRNAGFGFVWDESGVYQIRMCNPVEMSDDLQPDVMNFNPAFRMAHSVGQALNAEKVLKSGGGSAQIAGLTHQLPPASKHLASPALLYVAGTYLQAQMMHDETVHEKFLKAARDGWPTTTATTTTTINPNAGGGGTGNNSSNSSSNNDWKACRSKLAAIRRIDNIRRKIKAH